MHDIIIIGSGPAGLTAGIYACRSKLRTLMLTSQVNPSLITTTDLVENYPGFPGGISGYELVERFRSQATSFGLEIVEKDAASLERITVEGRDAWRVHVHDGTYEAHAVIIATGTEYAHLNVPGEQEFTGRGVSYCATCDGPFYRNAHVVVVGGGNAAVQEALFLTKFAGKVTIIHRRDRLRADKTLQEKALAHEKIGVLWDSVVEEIMGNGVVKSIRVSDVKDPEKKQTLEAEGVFIFTGNIPNTSFVRGVVGCDEQGFIQADHSMRTSAPGIFACGDCTRKLLRQVVTACGDGATAAFAAEQYIQELKGTAYSTWSPH
jgi:thioredoxin reductase (NADPH)